MKYKKIKHVAIYLRKSRDEGDFEDVLAKHRNALTSFVKSKGWTYEILEEIASGESIQKRQKMQTLLRNVDNGCYDGVVVVDFDRLSRGSYADLGKIEEAFKSAGTLIITPQKIYDLEDDSDALTIGIKSFVSTEEYKIIKRRLRDGKINGAQKGMWTSGQPPFPYYYDRLKKVVLVDDIKRFYYREMVERYISGSSLTEIAQWLTNNVSRQRKDTMGKRSKWSTVVVKRILSSEVHLGYVIFGKHKGKKGVRQVLPQEQWIKSKGTHVPLKTEEEHQKIMARLALSKTINPKARSEVLPLSGMMFCEKCGARMIVKTVIYKNGNKSWCVLCSKRHEDKSCNQKSSVLNEDFFDGLYQRVVHIDENLQWQLQEHNKDITKYKQLLAVKEKELKKHHHAIERLYEMREEDSIDKSTFLERKKMREEQIQAMKEEIEDLKLVIQEQSDMPSMEKLKQQIKVFKDKWMRLESVQERNRLLKRIVGKIMYHREDNNVYLGIQYN
ncbi:recombinase family protein [Dendrosporobacter sp. 1207_IL3150]|uniref:recombinase family protein n=1 Tax=Dendrosporobacter sp. 1207_IL3150 TaxID=3084054 RepID=UPI002FDAB374